MEISLVRNRLTQTIERAKREAAERRTRTDHAGKSFDSWLNNVAVPLMRQIGNVLRSEGYLFTVFTPSGAVRIMSDRSAEDYIELSLDTSDETPRVVSYSRRSRGSRTLDSERVVGDLDDLTEDALLEFLLKELEAFVDR